MCNHNSEEYEKPSSQVWADKTTLEASFNYHPEITQENFGLKIGQKDGWGKNLKLKDCSSNQAVNKVSYAEGKDFCA